MTAAKKKISKARLMACKKWPCATHAILTLRPVERASVGTMAVDQFWRLYYNPEFIEPLPIEELAGVILHEAMHLLGRHHRRLAAIHGKNAPLNLVQLWNIATDCAINSLLKKEGVKLPDWEVDGGRLNVCSPLSSTCQTASRLEYYMKELLKNAETVEVPAFGLGVVLF